MSIYQFTILGKPVSQKNSKRILRNQRTNVPFISSNEGVKDWHASAAFQLAQQWRGNPTITGVAVVTIRSFIGAGQRGDVDNLACAPMDALQHAGIIKSDYQIERLVSERTRDRDNPRVEITLIT